MQPYRFEFVHLKGETNKVTDTLSRTPEFKCTALEVHSAPLLHREELIDAARKDPGYVRPLPVGDRRWEKREDLWVVDLGP